MKGHSLKTQPLGGLTADDMIALLESKVADYQEQINIELLEIVQELHAHNLKGLHAVKAKALMPEEEFVACRAHISGLLATLDNMSHISSMAEMDNAQKIVREILTEVLNQIDSEIR